MTQIIYLTNSQFISVVIDTDWEHVTVMTREAHKC